MNLFAKAIISTAIVLSASAANAYNAGDFIVRAGAISVNPDASSAFVAPGILDVTVDVDNNTQLGLTGTYMFSPNLGVEVVAATPFSHDITVNEVALKAGDTKHLPPTVMLQYYLNKANAAFQPFLGLGLNYTYFFESNTSNDLDGVLAALLNTNVKGDLNLGNSSGLAMQAGFDYAFNDNMGLTMSVYKMDIDTTATVYANDTKVTSFEVAIDPMVYMAGVFYRF